MQGKHVGGRFPNLEQVCARIDSGFYNQPEVIDQIIPALRRDLENPSLEQPGPAPLSIRPPTRQDRDPRATPNAGTTGRDGAGFFSSGQQSAVSGQPLMDPESLPGPLSLPLTKGEPEGVIQGGQGRDRDDVYASMMVIVYLFLAAVAWAAAGVAALFIW